MAKNIPSNEVYEQISEWLDLYRTTQDYEVKAKCKTNIVMHMFPVVKHLAKTVARRANDPIDDLSQAGFIGLLKAIDRYSEEKNDNFRVYAGYLIIGEMKHFLRDKLNTIRVPRHVQELCIRINAFTNTLTYDELKNLTSEDVASALEVSTDTVNVAMMADRRRSTISLEEVFSVGNGSLSYEEVLVDDKYKEDSELEDAKIIFNSVIDKLPPEERVVIDMYYKQDMNKKEIADALQVSIRYVNNKMQNAIDLISATVAENSLNRSKLKKQ